MKKKIFSNIAIALVGFGAVNLGFTKFLNFNLVDTILSPTSMSLLNQIVYGLVAISGIYTLYCLFLGKK